MGWSATAKIWLVVALLAVGIVLALVLAPWADQPAVAKDVARAQARFDASGIGSYTVVVSRECFGCDPQPFLVTVKHGELTAVDGKASRRLPQRLDWVREWGPIDRGLASASDTASDHDFRTKLSFDRHTGVPRSFTGSATAKYVGDGWFTFHWSNFQQTR
jgi:uncharacterized protein DUF6174